MNQNFTIYIVEDDPDINEILEDNLWREGYRIRTFTDGMKAYDAISKSPPDLVVLDLNLPSMSGIELCKYVRSNDLTVDIPVIMLTARSEEIDKIIGFEVGADDYVTKPFSPRELLARVKVHLKRSKKSTFDEVQQDNLRVNFSTHEVFVDDEAVELTPIQFKLLKHLIMAEGKAVSRQNLLDSIWGEDYFGDPRTVDVHITRLREKIDKDSKFILTVKGVGYRWNRV
ncbi:MAG TPA: response regulator transcription factor [Calditrichia bacterium]|nr:response regulator transcription factor [Calditrichota bacterium]HQU73387.1 response regulator transcription factor [Calditrichia bacterium]HQV32867.1 response regulator transcription factor [Calditrichia bacterium]